MTAPKLTVAQYHQRLVHLLTLDDMALAKREAKRGIVNIYRLGQYFAAADRVASMLTDVWQSNSPEALKLLCVELNGAFSLRCVDKLIAEIKA